MKLRQLILFLKKRTLRNKKSISGNKFLKHGINFEFGNSHDKNVGDTLTMPLMKYLSDEYNLSQKFYLKAKHLYCIGSIICFGLFDATIWGSGFLSKDFAIKLKKNKYIKYDVRAVRGPLTRNLLIECGYKCPEVYGDPAILYEKFYKPKVDKKYNISLITHYADTRYNNLENIHKISVETNDFKHFIDEIASSEVVISSSLHGIILSETYGVPCIWLKSPNLDELKYFDWYYSTGRQESKIQSAESLEEALNLSKAACLPPTVKIRQLADNLLKSFPFDLFKKNPSHLD